MSLCTKPYLLLSYYRCIKVAVVPSVNVSWATKPVGELKAPKFAEVFAVTLAEHRLYTNTIQLNVWSLHAVQGDECLVSAVSFVSLSVLHHCL